MRPLLLIIFNNFNIEVDFGFPSPLSTSYNVIKELYKYYDFAIYSNYADKAN